MVKISAHQESTIDYPGKMGEILFVSGCDFRCGFCHNPELVDGKINEIDLEGLLKNINSKVRTGWYQGITISGGEPTIYKDLPEFMKRLKDMGLRVKLDTNGSNPEMLRRILKDELADYVAMDIKGPRKEYAHIVQRELDMENIDRSINIVKLFPDYEFRTTVLPFFNKGDFEDIGKWISNSEDGKIKKVRLYTLQQFSNKKTLDPEYVKLIPKPSKEIFELRGIMQRYADNVRVLV